MHEVSEVVEFVLDSDRHILWACESVTALLGWAPETLLGLDLFRLSAPQDAQSWSQRQTFRDRLPVRLRDSHGRYVTFAAATKELADPGGETVAFAITLEPLDDAKTDDSGTAPSRVTIAPLDAALDQVRSTPGVKGTTTSIILSRRFER
mgnify:CR=1 FL=1